MRAIAIAVAVPLLAGVLLADPAIAGERIAPDQFPTVAECVERCDFWAHCAGTQRPSPYLAGRPTKGDLRRFTKCVREVLDTCTGWPDPGPFVICPQGRPR